MDNLPNDKNQAVDNNQNVTNDNPPVTPPETPPIPTIEKPPEEKPETPPPKPQIETPPPSPTEEQPKPEEQPKEQPIEVGSLEQQTAFTSYTQGATDDNSKPKKSKKLKTIVSVLGILLIIAALPLTVILVKQRQEIRKEAASGTVTVCGVTVATAGYKLNSNFSYTGKYFLSNTSGRNVEMTIRVDGCACSEGNLPQCNNNCIGENRNITVPPSGLSQEVTTPSNPDDCGTFQTDIKVMSCSQL